MPTNETVWNVAAEYFRLFRYGYVSPQMAVGTTSDDVSELMNSNKSHAQLNFLQSTMASDDVRMELVRLEKAPGAGESLIATTSISLTITENTLRYVYPHLTDNGEGEWSPLADKLLNQHIVMRGSVHFDWDRLNGWVARLESKVDILTPMMRLLGNLEDVARVFDGAFIALECALIVKEE
ncbi:hypothetical protein BBJ29_005157 [Phytophthora kernoviae]|uniref:Uncharacterized protein n=1 Tax=Phytophthora kernoviae TaxID=325452 RepID=A0A3R7GLU7_9STRA|nr:hypothetical protein BBJ29_005157 [Phytophthora kernoviae]